MEEAAGCDPALVTHGPKAPPGSTGKTKECQGPFTVRYTVGTQ